MKQTVLLLTLVALSGCATEEQVNADFQNAMTERDYRLLQLPGRGGVLPGIDTQERKLAAELCGVKLLEGVSDIVRDSEELEKLQAVTKYAEEYNLRMYDECQKSK